MESDQEDRKSQSKSINSERQDNKEEGHINMNHEDLSDVSDLDSMGADDGEKDEKVFLSLPLFSLFNSSIPRSSRIDK